MIRPTMKHLRGQQRVVNGQVEQDCIQCGASRTTANGDKQFVMYGPWTIKECDNVTETWNSPALINKDAIDQIITDPSHKDLLERLLKL